MLSFQLESETGLGGEGDVSVSYLEDRMNQRGILKQSQYKFAMLNR